MSCRNLAKLTLTLLALLAPSRALWGGERRDELA